MATTELIHSTPAGAGERLRRVVEAGLARLVALWQAAQNRRRVARLLEWDDRMLRDVGLTAGDVRSALASPLGDDPSYRLGALSRERRRAFQAAANERLAQQGDFQPKSLRGAAAPVGRGNRRSA